MAAPGKHRTSRWDELWRHVCIQRHAACWQCKCAADYGDGRVVDLFVGIMRLAGVNLKIKQGEDDGRVYTVPTLVHRACSAIHENTAHTTLSPRHRLVAIHTPLWQECLASRDDSRQKAMRVSGTRRWGQILTEDNYKTIQRGAR